LEGVAVTAARTSFPVRGSARTTNVIRCGAVAEATLGSEARMGEAANASIEQIYTLLFLNNTFALNILTANIISWACPIRLGGCLPVAKARVWAAIRRCCLGAAVP
jgi:hypothetical protein